MAVVDLAPLQPMTMPWGSGFPLAVGTLPSLAALRHCSGVKGTWWYVRWIS